MERDLVPMWPSERNFKTILIIIIIIIIILFI